MICLAIDLASQEIQTVPMRQVRSCFVGALEKVHEHLFGLARVPNVVVAQEEQASVGTVPGGTGPQRGCREARWFRNRIRVERRLLERCVTWPESTTDHFMRVGFARDPIGSLAFRCASSRKTCHREVEASPEKLDRAALADKLGPECFKDSIRLYEDTPEAVGIFRVIGSMDIIFITSDGIRHFTWQRVDGHVDLEGAQCFHKL